MNFKQPLSGMLKDIRAGNVDQIKRRKQQPFTSKHSIKALEAFSKFSN